MIAVATDYVIIAGPRPARLPTITLLRHGRLKLQLVGTAKRQSKTGPEPQSSSPYPVETGPTH